MNPPRVIFLGRLAEEKGIQQVLRAAQRLPEFQFRIGGDGPLRKRVETEAARTPNLKFLGWLTRSQVRLAIDQSDILVLPSRLETFGTVALEALARRRLVLITRHCGIAHCPTLAQGLFTIQDGENVTAALQRVASLPSWQRESIAAQGWKAVEQFNNETIQGWLNALAEVMGVALPASGLSRAVG
jgi:glycosyltransferase involved in cell wall biosynthesis